MALTAEQREIIARRLRPRVAKEIESIEALIKMLELPSATLFMAVPPLESGDYAILSDDTEKRCVQAVLKELRKNRKRLKELEL